MRAWRWAAAGALACVSVAAVGLSRAADPSALWHIIDDRCVPDQQRAQDPSPCAAVDLSQGRSRGYVVLKDIVGVAQYLVMPTTRVHGIEDPAILAPGAPNLWAPAWEVRRFVDARLPRNLARDEVSLAINSMFGRTQNQLHIHVDCVRPEVKAALLANLAAVEPRWTPFPVPLAGHRYRAMRVDGATLAGVDPFRLLAAGHTPAAEMGQHTLVVVGATFAGGVPGFILLDDGVDLMASDLASGEQLQDHSCALAFAR